MVTPAPSASVDVLAPARAVVQRWNDAHAKHDAAALDGMYAPRVAFYGKSMTPAECHKANDALFKSTPDFTQSVRDVVIEPGTDGKTSIARFTKTATAKGKTTDYPSYLVLASDLRITEESDSVTDANLKAMSKKPRVIDIPPTNCDEALGKIAVWMGKKYPVTGEQFSREYGDAKSACSEVHAVGKGAAPRQYSFCVDLVTGATVATGGWLMIDASDHDIPLDVPDPMPADVAALCKGKKP
jgi:hypothetical protein